MWNTLFNGFVFSIFMVIGIVTFLASTQNRYVHVVTYPVVDPEFPIGRLGGRGGQVPISWWGSGECRPCSYTPCSPSHTFLTSLLAKMKELDPVWGGGPWSYCVLI